MSKKITAGSERKGESVERVDGEVLGAHATSIGYTAAALAIDSLHVLRRLLLLRLFD